MHDASTLITSTSTSTRIAPPTAWPRRLARLAWAAATVWSLAACGGGGGGEGGDGTPAPGTNPTPAPPPAVALSGRLWHDNYALDFREGTQIASPSGQLPVQVTNSGAAQPWLDGSQFVTHDWDVGENITTFSVIDLASGTTLYSARANGYLRGLVPSRTSKSLMVGALSDSTVGPFDWVFVELSTMKVVKQIEGLGGIDWLPDGRYLRVLPDGAIRVGEVQGGEQATGQLTLPPATVVAQVWVNRQGTQLALRLVHQVSPSDESDIWLAPLDGSTLERLTSTKMSYTARWSPEGRQIAFDVDTGYLCNNFGCAGTCETWWVPVTARNVRALPALGDAWPFTVQDRRGRPQTLGCDLIAWTD